MITSTSVSAVIFLRIIHAPLCSACDNRLKEYDLYSLFSVEGTKYDHKKALTVQPTEANVCFDVPVTRRYQPLCVSVRDFLGAEAKLCFANMTVRRCTGGCVELALSLL